MSSEKAIERYLCEQVKGLKGEAYKFVSPMRRFVLDRICVMPHGKVWFVELKSTGQRPCEGQMREITRLVSKGHHASWADSKEDVDNIIKLMREEQERCRRG